MPRSFLVKKTEKVKHVSISVEPKALPLETEKIEITETKSDISSAPDRKELLANESKQRVLPTPSIRTHHHEDLPAFPPTWMLPYHHHPGVNAFDALPKSNRDDLYGKKFYVNDERTVSPFLSHASALHPLSMRFENGEYKICCRIV